MNAYILREKYGVPEDFDGLGSYIAENHAVSFKIEMLSENIDSRMGTMPNYLVSSPKERVSWLKAENDFDAWLMARAATGDDTVLKVGDRVIDIRLVHGRVVAEEFEDGKMWVVIQPDGAERVTKVLIDGRITPTCNYRRWRKVIQ
jgi:hypothetical protein